MSPGSPVFQDLVHILSMLTGVGFGPKLPLGAPGACTVSLGRRKEPHFLPAIVWLMFTPPQVLRDGHQEGAVVTYEGPWSLDGRLLP